MNVIQRDQAFGRRLARNGGRACISTHRSHVPDNMARIHRWRAAANEPGANNTMFTAEYFDALKAREYASGEYEPDDLPESYEEVDG